ncbi:MAG: hypothetical protein IJ087_09820 [Eggerthellaceae bacterium]|nr:hypothetical protein [Eggerthellaceae bacterium]
MAIRRRVITDEDLRGFSLEQMGCMSCSGACGWKVFALYGGEPFTLCGKERETADFLVAFNEKSLPKSEGSLEDRQETLF